MTAALELWSRDERNGRRLLRRKSPERWSHWDESLSRWRTLETRAALELLEHERAQALANAGSRLAKVAATFLAGEFSA